MKLNLRFLLPYFLIIFIILGDIFGNSNSIMKYSDEISFVIFTIVFFLRSFKSSEMLSRLSLRILLLCVLLFLIGFFSCFLFKIRTAYFPILLDAVAVLKIPICCIGFYSLIDKNQCIKILNRLKPIAKGFLIISFIFAIISLFFDIGMGGELRYGIHSFNFIYDYTHKYAMMVLFSLIILSFSYKDKKGFLFYCIIGFIELLLTTKGTSIITALAMIFIYYYSKNNMKFSIRTIIPLLIIAIIFGGYQIDNYLLNSVAPRTVFIRYGISTCKNYFPLGSGFATFGSDMAAKYYSPLYYQYGFQYMNGMTPTNPAFLNDNYWPMILGQFGIVGITIVLYILYQLFKLIQNLKDNYKSKFIVLSSYFYLLLSSLGASIFTTSTTIVLLFGILLIIKIDSKGAENNE